MYKKMNPAIKKQWCDALLSGDYSQANYALRSPDNKFCCLGVLCNLHAIAYPKIAARQTRQCSYLGKDNFLPNAVADWAGISRREYYMGDVQGHLAGMNDDGRSFTYIANWIEKNL